MEEYLAGIGKPAIELPDLPVICVEGGIRERYRYLDHIPCFLHRCGVCVLMKELSLTILTELVARDDIDLVSLDRKGRFVSKTGGRVLGWLHGLVIERPRTRARRCPSREQRRAEGLGRKGGCPGGADRS